MKNVKRLMIILAAVMIAGRTSYIEAKAQGASDTWTFLEMTIDEVSEEFDFSPYLLASLIYEESRFTVKDNLTQITSKKWFSDGFDYCGSDDISNEYVNIRCCCYYLHRWAEEEPGEPALWLMEWNEGYENAKARYNPNNPSSYAKRILKRAEKWEEQGNNDEFRIEVFKQNN